MHLRARSRRRGLAIAVGVVATLLTAPSPAETAPSLVETAPSLAGIPDPPPPPRVTADTVGKPWGTVEGLLQFRGNPTRTWYGRGPVPQHPQVLWRFPRREKMCAFSKVGPREPSEWCGTGWTGQPAVWERPDGVTEVIFGAFDKKVHFLNAETGERTRPDFATKDIIKGSVTIDPDGYPLLYFGSRDNRLRVIALDRNPTRWLWSLRSSDYPGIYDNDWDGNPSIVDDHLITGGENGYFFVVKLNRGYDAKGRVTVAPEVKLALPGWTKELFAKVGDRSNGIESSAAVFEDRAYFANGLGRVVGVDLNEARQGRSSILFDYWVGDDVDASVVVDEQGMLYVAVELERFLPRSREVGQLVKLDPQRDGDPRVWGVEVPPGIGDERGGGIWSTPALGDGVLYVTTQAGDLMVVDRETGAVAWRESNLRHLWSSPALVDDTLIVATCEGELRAYDVRDPRRPERRWNITLGEGICIESTPAVWRGRIFVGSWDGHFYAIGDPPALAGME